MTKEDGPWASTRRRVDPGLWRPLGWRARGEAEWNPGRRGHGGKPLMWSRDRRQRSDRASLRPTSLLPPPRFVSCWAPIGQSQPEARGQGTP